MTRSAKTVSVSQLQAAIKNALDATRKTHPDANIQPAVNGGAEAFYYRPYWLCGGPIIPPDWGLDRATEFAATFTGHISKEPAVKPLEIDGKLEPAVYVAGGKITVGFVPGDASLTE